MALPGELYICDDLPISFERDTGLNIDHCCNIIEDPDSVFCGFSYIIKFILTLINSFNDDTLTLVIKDIIPSLRRTLYIELSKIKIPFTKTRYTGTNLDPRIYILTGKPWYVPDYRTGLSDPGLYSTYATAPYLGAINSFNELYSSIENLGCISVSGTHYNTAFFIVSLEYFIQFKRIELFSRRRQLISPTQTPYSLYEQSHNYKIKHQLSDLVFDIKENITDSTFKEMMEKIALIST